MRAQRASEAKRAKRRTCMNFHAWISERVHDAFLFVSNLFICIFVFLIPFPTYLNIFLTPFPMYLHVFLIFFSLYLHLFCIPTYLCIHFLRIYLIHYQNVLKAFSKVFKKWCALPVPLLRQVLVDGRAGGFPFFHILTGVLRMPPGDCSGGVFTAGRSKIKKIRCLTIFDPQS